MDKHILVFGTSTTYGAWDSEGGWVQRLRKYFDNKIIASGYKEYVLVYNLGVSGDKSADILRRFEAETEARKGGHGEETMILCHLGINDCIYNDSLSSLEVSSEQFKENYKQLISLAKQYSQKIIIIGSMPVDKRVDPMPWSSGRSYKNEYVEQFNKIMKEVANETKVSFIEIYQRFINENYSKLLADGVHMTAEGHRQLFEIVKERLVNDKWL
ncbi:hypothetical protein A3B45_02515 [Candidatus Daviesbacteria bacterium RIFCSPLOWO2_01_FULL_39_12]|uniref:SGNH hydrolase-type esterase domain-containing protein n=1 Tax=Candidatus Daviesbacteria bacterium RIFCSPLOWO2_01_FULL_39_12 TaxID=1797785 RepID=A0A1F5KST1_9BACT|nr:MAG: hypothetical protein A3D79_03610 [Candidatus Daviesbacteria bacterium RIFCSPHIGHO2_02_FULL_39_8]OGE43880.1 MAG: hypothetical protein A3B45_02515 [Candidatus Daviesbacteria bacterium RIFCSPLOWO2_01_FULL_39_12]